MRCGDRCLMLVWLLLGSLMLGPTNFCQGEEAAWQAGVGRLVITPEQPMWMSGYAGRTGPAEGTLHDLWAKAVAFKSPQGQVGVLISLDLVGIGGDLTAIIMQQLKQKYGLEREQVVLCTSHTHCGPVLGETLTAMYFLDDEQQRRIDDYTAAFPGKMVQVVGEALDSLAPATLHYGVGETDFAVNRRENVEAEVPRLREEGALKGPVDHAVHALFVKSPEGKVRAVLFGYACHATTLGFQLWNGDWPGFGQIAIEKQFPGATALFVAGCGADQNPLPRRTVELAEKYGNMVAAAVQETFQQELTTVTGPFRLNYREIDVPFSQLPGREQLEMEIEKGNRYEASRARRLLALLDEQGKLPSSYAYPIQSWMLGPVQMVFLGGEVVVDYSLRLKGDLDNPALWVGGYCNDVMAYIPSRRVLMEGGYEGARSMVYYGQPTTWSPQIEPLIVEEVSRQLTP